jgi:hypothetical protein
MKDAFYFPHFSNARHDRKIRRVRKELGGEGYGIYFMILETLRDQNDYIFPMEDIDLLADEYGTSEQKIRTVICNYGLFETNEDDDFTSPKLIEFLKPYAEGKERKRINGIRGNLIRYKHITKDQSSNMKDDEILALSTQIKSRVSNLSLSEQSSDRKSSQKKGEEKKLKQIKESKSNNIEHFNNAWLLYPRKIGKKIILDSKTKLSEISSISIEEWTRIIKRYETTKPDYQDFAHGSTFFNKGYYDFTDSVFIEPVQDISNKLDRDNCKTQEEWRYYNYIDVAGSNPSEYDKKAIEAKRLEMEESFK